MYITATMWESKWTTAQENWLKRKIESLDLCNSIISKTILLIHHLLFDSLYPFPNHGQHSYLDSWKSRCPVQGSNRGSDRPKWGMAKKEKRHIFRGHEEPENGAGGAILENFGNPPQKKWPKNGIKINFGKNFGFIKKIFGYPPWIVQKTCF